MAEPPSPLFSLRGHTSEVTTLCLFDRDSKLLSGDAGGNIFIWSIAIRRPLMQWRGHSAGLLNVISVPEVGIVSQGRDDQMIIWEHPETDPKVTKHGEPKKLDTILVNSLNYCHFSPVEVETADGSDTLIAMTGSGDNAEIDVYNLTQRKYMVQGIAVLESDAKTGLCMCISPFLDDSKALLLLAGYETGEIIFWRADEKSMLWRFKAHSEPVLSMALTPDATHVFSGGADTTIRKSTIPLDPGVLPQSKVVSVGAAGQACLACRPDGKIVISGGWDSKIRVFSAKKLTQLAVLSGHKEGVHAVAFPEGKFKPTQAEIEELDYENVPIPANMFASGSNDRLITFWQIY
ncbi:WD40-repeat-containing domain protein [Phlyctochytrium arcticum]|nr:WD40-repeat-containing domain protein [Phlyctochytrium arcticum]